MITPDLHRQPVAVDREKHRRHVLRTPVTDWRFTSGLNALFVVAAEVPAAARDFPVVFIKAGQDAQGAPEFAPIAVLGLAAGENLYVDADGSWRAAHVPAQLALYPMCVARVDAQSYAVCVDAGSPALADSGPGERLFDDAGEPTAFLRRVQVDLEGLERQVEQTRDISRRLHGLDLLVERRFDATTADGRKIGVDGFLTVDEDRLRALPDDTVLALHREGLLALIHAHLISMGHMRRLVGWKVLRDGPAAPAPQSASMSMSTSTPASQETPAA